MKKVLSLSVLAVFLCFTPAFAQGPYLGAGLVYNNPLSSDISYLDPGFGVDFRFGFDFGPVALEANLMGSGHDDTDPGYGNADFGGFSLDLRIFLTPQMNDPNQIYLLVGIGSYWIDEFDPYFFPTRGADIERNGSGLNFGAGLEHYINTNLALNIGLIYRLIRYDEIDAEGITYLEDVDGDTLSLQFGINYHF